MQYNIGQTDRVWRVVIGLALLFLASYLSSWIVALLGVIVIVTALVRWCGVYALFGINTNRGQRVSMHRRSAAITRRASSKKRKGRR